MLVGCASSKFSLSQFSQRSSSRLSPISTILLPSLYFACTTLYLLFLVYDYLFIISAIKGSPDELFSADQMHTQFLVFPCMQETSFLVFSHLM
ncbi:unnamed protein product [Acanthoscelides obtectus]|uniref:Uncharacterized protein n=1 Tax=Acanthoscelides obtectus TaxID=200917 RepID=A0A9P0MD92_ACAOB|nr:unnamed protein product [Acanthoscelides obtectus]CAK1681109.1 hypothetical protein AOBTE_LOCUS33021 [Acanthoscelides obtectus]